MHILWRDITVFSILQGKHLSVQSWQPALCQMSLVCEFCTWNTHATLCVCVWSLFVTWGHKCRSWPPDVGAHATWLFTLNRRCLRSHTLLLLQLWISLFQLLTAGGAGGWGEADKRHLSVCGILGFWLWFVLTPWPNQQSELKQELVSSHVLLRCLHDVRF